MRYYASTESGFSGTKAGKGSNSILSTTLKIGNKEIGRVVLQEHDGVDTIYWYPIGMGGMTLLHKGEKQKGECPDCLASGWCDAHAREAGEKD